MIVRVGVVDVAFNAANEPCAHISIPPRESRAGIALWSFKDQQHIRSGPF